MEHPPQVVVVVGLLHVGDDEVVELLLVEEGEVPLPADVEVWVQVQVVVVVGQVPQPEHGPMASQQPQAAPAHDCHRSGSISGQDDGVAQTTAKVQRTLMGLMPM